MAHVLTKRVRPLRCLLSVRYSTQTQTKVDDQPKSEYFDVVISGGGMVGTSMALALGKEDLFKDLKIALIESSDKKHYLLPPHHSNRVSALNKKSVDLLKYLECFEYVERARYCKVHQMQVWDACSDSMINFKTQDLSQELAIIVENDLIQASLTDKLDSVKNLKVFYTSKIDDFQVRDDENVPLVEIRMNNNTIINTKLLIGSDGHNSYVREKLKFSTTKYDYGQLGVVATVKVPKEINDTAWQRFLPTGPLALLPLDDEHSTLVWSMETNLAREMMKLSDEEFVNKLNHAFIDESDKDEFTNRMNHLLDSTMNFIGSTLNQENIVAPNAPVAQLPAKVERVIEGTRAAFPLQFMHSNNYVKKRIALIGDSAHRIHPLAGQGVNIGFGDVISLTDKLTECIKNGAELGSLHYLQKYESERQRDAYPKALFIHLLNTLYTTRQATFAKPLILLRSLGLTMTNRLEFLKQFYLEGAMK